MKTKDSNFFESIKYSPNYSSSMDDGIKKLAIDVTKPITQVYFTAHKEYEFESCAIKVKDKVYLLSKDLWEKQSRDLKPFKFYLCQTRKGNCFFWPLKGSLQDQKLDPWNTSAHHAIKDAKSYWIRLISNQEMGKYDVMFANDQTTTATWPDKTLEELLEIAFENRIISDENDPILRELRGEI